MSDRAHTDPLMRLARLTAIGMSLAWGLLLMLHVWCVVWLWQHNQRRPIAEVALPIGPGAPTGDVGPVLPCPRPAPAPLPAGASEQKHTAHQKAEIEAEQDCSIDARFGRSIRVDAWGRRTARLPGASLEGSNR